MSFKYLFVLFSVLICANAKSFTVVIDTTYSMKDEINMIRASIGYMVDSIRNTSSIENYIIVPFNDPVVGPAKTFTTTDSFMRSMNSLTVSGGHDIPENSLSGLEKALQESKPESDIFLFTDACAKDEGKFNDIQRLCRVTGSKVFVFMSGRCSYSKNNEYGNIETYYLVTKVCFGNVFQLDRNDYRQAFRFMTEIIKDGYNDVRAVEPFSEERSLYFSAQVLTRGVIVAVNGKSPTIELTDKNGHSPRTEILIETLNSQVVRIVEPHIGKHTAIVRSQGVTSVTIYKRNEFPLIVGFSPFSPQSFEETASQPLPGRDNFIFVFVPRSYRYTLNTLTIHVLNDDSHKTMSLTESGVNAQIFIAQSYFKPGSKFRMTIDGIDSVTSESVRMISKSWETQTEVTSVPWSAAVVKSIIPESTLIDYKKNTRVACKVTGCPQPRIWWEYENGQKMEAEDSLLEYPATYISYVGLTSLMENKTITCKASTSTGEDSQSIDLYVYRPYIFKILRTPQDTTIPFEEEGKLYCEVDAYPDPNITWYFNDNEIIFQSNEVDDDNLNEYFKEDKVLENKKISEYFKEDNALVIKNMSSEYVGKYRCDARNEANYKSFSVEVRISGLEYPEVEMDTDVTSKLGESVQIACRIIKGKPNPTLTWKYQPVDGYEFTDLPDDINVEEGKLTINEVMSKHKGIYQCEAVNEQGRNSRELNLKVIYAPRMENAETVTKEVLVEKPAVLECNVDAEPKAEVKWERLDGASFPDERHSIDGNSLKFVARYDDLGSYRCIAENEAGVANKTINVNVLVPPYITPFVKTITVRAGDLLKLQCNVEKANPPPSMEWTFTPLDSEPTSIFRGESVLSKELVYSKATKSQSGKYHCSVRNKVGGDYIEVDVYVA